MKEKALIPPNAPEWFIPYLIGLLIAIPTLGVLAGSISFRLQHISPHFGLPLGILTGAGNYGLVYLSFRTMVETLHSLGISSSLTLITASALTAPALASISLAAGLLLLNAWRGQRAEP